MDYIVTQAELDALKNVRLSEDLKKEIIIRHRQGQSKASIARELEVSLWSVKLVLSEKSRNHGRLQSLKYRGLEEPLYVTKSKQDINQIQTEDPIDTLLEQFKKAQHKGIPVGDLGSNANELLNTLENKGHTFEYVQGCIRFATNPETQVNENAIQNMFRPNRTKYGFAVITDTHFGGYQAQPWFVKQVLEEAARRNYDFIAHVGDHLDGPPSMHKGFEFELGLTKADDQVDFAVELYSKSELPIVGITGNHDGSFFKATGLDVGRMMQERCDQFFHIGPIQGWIEGPNGDPEFIRLFHPGDGCSYALSYKDQKTAEFLALSDSKCPTAFHFTGHYHKYNSMRGPNGARYFLAPASCGTTSFMKAKRLINQAGALFIEFTLDSKGRVDRCIIEDVLMTPDTWVKCDYSSFKSATSLNNQFSLWS